MPPQHPPCAGQPSPKPQPIRSAIDEPLLPFEIAPAPPLISRLTLPPHSGQVEIGGSDIFCRRSKWWLHAVHSYS